MTTSDERQADRHEAVRYSEAENKLRLLTTLLNDLAANAHADRDTFYTFAEPVRNAFRQSWEQLAQTISEMADDALEVGDHYRGRLGLEVA